MFMCPDSREVRSGHVWNMSGHGENTPPDCCPLVMGLLRQGENSLNMSGATAPMSKENISICAKLRLKSILRAEKTP